MRVTRLETNMDTPNKVFQYETNLATPQDQALGFAVDLGTQLLFAVNLSGPMRYSGTYLAGWLRLVAWLQLANLSDALGVTRGRVETPCRLLC